MFPFPIISYKTMFHAELNDPSDIASPCLTPVDTLKGLLPVIAMSTLDILSFSVIFISFIILLVCHNILKHEIIDIISLLSKACQILINSMYRSVLHL